jgi:hypothetical protein
VESIYDFNGEDVFGGVATRYCLTHFIRDKKNCFPKPFYRMNTGTWSAFIAKPMFHQTDPLSVWIQVESDNLVEMTPILIKKESCPRQGINTCGANDIFFFDELEEKDTELVQVSNRRRAQEILPKQFLFPLITTHDFKSDNLPPFKWVLLPYNRNGKPLNGRQIKMFPTLERYFFENIAPLQNRKGVMLNAMLKRGYWWALMGVGAYNFFPYKIVWEAYGKTNFNPKIFEGNWQANQSLQAFIPVKSLKEAERILYELSDKKIEDYLLSLKMEGTMNWAQPGKIKKLVQYEEESLTLF